MKNEGLSSFINELVLHTHSRLDTLLPGEEREREQILHDGSLSLEALVWYAQELSNQHNVLIGDTDHPIHVIDRKGLDRSGAFGESRFVETQRVISQGVCERAEAIRASELSPYVLTGIEADIVGVDGTLDVLDEALSSLDLVLASVHYSAWKEANGSQELTLDRYLSSILNAIDGHNIDVLAHPTRDMQVSHLRDVRVEDWDPILNTLIERNMAYEINASSFTKGYRSYAFERKLLEYAAKRGVNFIIGYDAHSFSDYDLSVPDRNTIGINAARDLFIKHTPFAHMRFFHRMAHLQKELGEYGIDNDHILTRSKETFLGWLNGR